MLKYMAGDAGISYGLIPIGHEIPNGVLTLYSLDCNRVGEGIASYGEATQEAGRWDGMA